MFGKVRIDFRVFCTIPVTVVEAEISFNKLENSLKTWQLITDQKRLNSLTCLPIEYTLAALFCPIFSSLSRINPIFPHC